MKFALRLFAVLHSLIAVLFAIFAVLLIITAAVEAWHAAGTGFGRMSAQMVIESMGLLAAGVVALQMAQTIAEEEVIRDAHISAPTRVRRFLSRFFVVILVALGVEGLVATFKAVHEDTRLLVYSAALLLATGVLLAAWGAFVRLNRSAEDLEPEAMEEAKREDRKVQG